MTVTWHSILDTCIVLYWAIRKGVLHFGVVASCKRPSGVRLKGSSCNILQNLAFSSLRSCA